MKARSFPRRERPYFFLDGRATMGIVHTWEIDTRLACKHEVAMNNAGCILDAHGGTVERTGIE